jgi:hypothetical protein
LAAKKPSIYFKAPSDFHSKVGLTTYQKLVDYLEDSSFYSVIYPQGKFWSSAGDNKIETFKTYNEYTKAFVLNSDTYNNSN